MLAFPDPYFFIASLILLGIVAGFVAGLFGMGGGIVLIPVLLALYQNRGIDYDSAMHAAMGVSLMSVVMTSITSIQAHAWHGAIDRPLLKECAAAVIMGATFGGVLSAYTHGAFLGLLFAIFLVCMAVFMGIPQQQLMAFKKVPSPLTRRTLMCITSFFPALLGIGGGSLTVPILTLFRLPIHRAVGTSSVISLLISLPAALVFFIAQYLRSSAAPGQGAHPSDLNLLPMEIVALILLVPITMVLAPGGARLAHRLPSNTLHRVFAALLLALAIKMFSDAAKAF